MALSLQKKDLVHTLHLDHKAVMVPKYRVLVHALAGDDGTGIRKEPPEGVSYLLLLYFRAGSQLGEYTEAGFDVMIEHGEGFPLCEHAQEHGWLLNWVSKVIDGP